MQVVLRRVRGRAKHPNWSGIATETMAALQKEVKPLLLGYAEKVVENWEHKPHFAAELKVTRQAVSVYVFPKGPNRDYWIWTSRGTKPHKIKPKGKARGGSDVLAFPSLYTPKTSPRGPSYGGPGKSSGDTVFAKEVDHPGTRARRFEEAWARWSKKPVQRALANAMRRGARKA